MKNYIMTAAVFCGALFAGAGASAAEVDYTYAEGAYMQYGSGKAETYNVAIRLADRAFVGSKVVSFSVPLEAAPVSDVKVWLSKELKSEKVDGVKVNVADIATVDATVADGMVKVSFPEAYTIGEEGVYVGYTFTVDEVNESSQKPLVMSTGINPDGFYILSSRTYYKWKTRSEKTGLVSAINVTLNGDFGEYSVALNSAGEAKAAIGQEFSLPVELANTGTSEVKSVGYVYSIDGGEALAGSYELPEAIPAVFNRKQTVYLPMQGIDSKGTKVVTVAIEKVNGNLNSEMNNYGEGMVKVLPFVPKHRVVMEEYTGTWCGYCVRGFAAMEHLNSLMPDDFIALAYHNGDPMAITNNFPSAVDGFPTSWIDRVFNADPYHGTSQMGFGILDDVKTRLSVVSPADISVTAYRANDNVTATATVTFAEEPDAEYTLAYFLLEDDMSGTGNDWKQSNYYADNAMGTADEFIPEMKQFCEGKESVRGLHFNDVVVMTSDVKGIPGSLDGVAAEVPASHSYTFSNISGQMNLSGEPVILNQEKLRAVGLLIDSATGQIVNAAKTDGYIPVGTGVNTIADGRTVVETRYYDLSGREISNPEAGVYVKVQKLDNGQSVTTKSVVK